MNMKKKPNREEGITLIALVVVIIILIILSAVTIRGITGNNGLVEETQVAAEDYKIRGYGEQIDQNVRGTILEHATMGDDASLQNIADRLNDETEWVKSAVVNEDETLGNGDILVTVHEGYVYDVYYDSTYGTVHVEYVGEDDGESFPSIIARYERSVATIFATAHDDGGIAKIELIYKEEVKDTRENPGNDTEVEFDASALGTGWYKVRAVANSGKLRYAWVRVTNVTDKLVTPIITLSPAEPNGENNWYTETVTVTISTESPAASEVHYILTGANAANAEDENGIVVPLVEKDGVKSISFTIGSGTYSNSGITDIVAWTEDGHGYKCKDDATEEVKFDNVKPTIKGTEVKATKGKDRTGKDTGWIVSTGTIEVTAEDTAGVLNGYYYKVTDDKTDATQAEEKYVSKIETPIELKEKEGEFQVIIQAVDQAGNRSGSTTVTVQKDTVAPNVSDITYNEATKTATTVDISVVAGDNTSGLSDYDYYLNGTFNKTQKTGLCTIESLIPNTDYQIYAKVYDNAGNSKDSLTLSVKTLGYLYAPNIEISGGQPTNGWYTSNVNVTITDSAKATETRAIKIRYTLDGTEHTENALQTSFAISTNGTHTLTAVAIDRNDESSTPTNQETIKIDQTAPTGVALTKGTVTLNTIPVTASGTEGTGESGIASYRYDYKEHTATNWNNGTPKVQNTHTYEELDAATDYDLRVVVKDNAGHETVSSEIMVTTLGDLFDPRITITGGGTKAGDWYTSDVTVTITDRASDSTTRATSIKYVLNGGAQTVTGRTATVTISTDGTYTLTAYAVDKKGEESLATEQNTIKLDKTAPTEPTIRLSGSQKIQGSVWYTGRVDAIITAGQEQGSGSGVNAVEYTVTKPNEMSKSVPLSAGQTTTVNITADGTTTINAWTKDLAGHKSAKAGTATVNKDETAPSNLSLSISSITTNQISVTASATETGSGIKSYKYNYRIENASQWTTGAEENGATHNYTSLQEGKKYELQLIVKDNAGNETTYTHASKIQTTDNTAPSQPTINPSGTMKVPTSGWYTGNVTFTITAGTDAGSGVKCVRYKVTGNTNIGQKEVTLNASQTSGTLETITIDGTCTVEAWTVDNSNNESTHAQATIKKDATPPNAPILKIANGATSVFSNGWYNQNVNVSVTANGDNTNGSGVSYVQYSTNGGSSYTKYTSGTTGVQLSSTTTMYGTAVDTAGNVTTTPANLTINIDKAVPTIGSVTTSGASATTATVSVSSVTDSGGSGIRSYSYYVNGGTSAQKTNSSSTGSNSYTITGLASGNTNKCKVEVCDNAGNRATKDLTNVATKLFTWEKWSMVGTLVDYTCRDGEELVVNVYMTTFQNKADKSYLFANAWLSVWNPNCQTAGSGCAKQNGSYAFSTGSFGRSQL